MFWYSLQEYNEYFYADTFNHFNVKRKANVSQNSFIV